MRLIIFEINEVPKKILQLYASSRPHSYFGRTMVRHEIDPHSIHIDRHSPDNP